MSLQFSRPLLKAQPTLLVLVLLASGVSAQTRGDSCHVYVVDIAKAKRALSTADKAEGDAAIAKALSMGQTIFPEFMPTLGEEELTTKHYPFPGSTQVITASVFYTDESMASEKGSDSVMLELALSTGQKRDVLHSLSWAEAEIQLNDFEVGRVTMLVKSGGRPRLVIMECRKDVRH